MEAAKRRNELRKQQDEVQKATPAELEALKQRKEDKSTVFKTEYEDYQWPRAVSSDGVFDPVDENDAIDSDEPESEPH